jgi:DNA-binding phage protein
MKTKTAPYNPFDYLETQEEINDYLTDAFIDDDPRVFLAATVIKVSKALGIKLNAKMM